MNQKEINMPKVFYLTDPCSLPNASAFLWNEVMMIQSTGRGYATAQFMQPEPSKYSHAPNLEMKTFMQPEQPYFAHHPGRFVYLKDEETGEIFSAPYEPVRKKPDSFLFVPGMSDISWQAEFQGILVEMVLSLSVSEPVEFWKIKVENRSGRERRLSIYPDFTIGYMSWMNQSAEYDGDLAAVVGTCVSPYQKYQDYALIKTLKDKTFLMAEKAPDYYEANQFAFEGEGGIWNPDGVRAEYLSDSRAVYEMPAAVMQYRTCLSDGERWENRFLFGAARTREEIAAVRNRYFENGNGTGFEEAIREYGDYVAKGRGCMTIETPDEVLNEFVNRWLPRQIYYHGITNRLTTDPQTRNYLQDGMGMAYMEPSVTREAFLTALGQQKSNGEMPDGILIKGNTELKYINQVPHTDHCVWLPLCLRAYLDETGDYTVLEEKAAYKDSETKDSVSVHMDKAMDFLLRNRDYRGLSYINQGDWCDPMNMVGYKGKGVSGWLTPAVAFALKEWAGICEEAGRKEKAGELKKAAESVNGQINRYLWDGNWYARGITDDDVVFGIHTDPEGSMFLNPQSFAILCGAADEEKRERIFKAVEENLETPYGAVMLAPAYTKMREDVGRVTQKFPGNGENGSVYNHAAAFYIYALYASGQKDNAWRLLRKMLPGLTEEDFERRGQLAVFVPNYYRGAYRQYPEKAGVSSQLFHTGTASWYYRSLVDGLFGVKGVKDGLQIAPALPSDWQEASLTRTFRGAEFKIRIKKEEGKQGIFVNGSAIEGNVIREIQKGAGYEVTVYTI